MNLRNKIEEDYKQSIKNKDQDKIKEEDQGSFIQIVNDEPKSEKPIVITYSNGVTLQLPPNSDLSMIRSLIQLQV